MSTFMENFQLFLKRSRYCFKEKLRKIEEILKIEKI